MTLPDIAAYAPYVSALAIALPMVAVIVRGRSFFPLHYRLWRLTYRKGDVSSEWLDKAINERVELMKCRSLVMWADSLAQARQIEKWAGERGIDLGTLGECGKFFERNELDVDRKIWKMATFRNVAFVLVYVAALFAIGGVALITKDEAVFSPETLGHSIHMSATTARPPGAHRFMAMTIKDCDSGEDPAGFGSDREIACGMLRDRHLPAAVSSIVGQQQAAGGALCVLAISMVIWLYVRGRSLRAAHAVLHQLRKREAEMARPQADGILSGGGVTSHGPGAG